MKTGEKMCAKCSELPSYASTMKKLDMKISIHKIVFFKAMEYFMLCFLENKENAYTPVSIQTWACRESLEKNRNVRLKKI